MEWKEVTLGEILNFRRGHDLPHSAMKPGKIPVAGSNGIIGYHNTATPVKPILTIGRSGNVGKPYFYEEAWAHNTTLYVDDFKGNDPKFLYYLCLTLPFAKFGGGSAVPTLNRNHIHPIETQIPVHISDQRRIASLLSSLDRKIELNNKINARLEEMAQAIFKNWFVDFEPFKDGKFKESELGMIPEGWKVGTLKDILVLRRENIKKEEKGDLPYLPIDIIPMHKLNVTEFKSNEEANSSLQVFEPNDIIIGAMRVYFHRVVLAPCKGITRTTCFVLKPKEKNTLAFSIMQCNQKDAIAHAERTSKGSTMPYAVWEGGLGEYQIVIPPAIVAKDFEKTLQPIFSKLNKNSEENSRLSSLRDTLLPRLMSGEIEIPE